MREIKAYIRLKKAEEVIHALEEAGASPWRSRPLPPSGHAMLKRHYAEDCRESIAAMPSPVEMAGAIDDT